LDELDAADLDHSVAALPAQAGGLGVQDDLAHAGDSTRRSGRGTGALRLGLEAGQSVHALVVWVARMPLDPAPVHLVPRSRRLQALPQVLVLDRAPAGGLPALADPPGHPL